MAFARVTCRHTQCTNKLKQRSPSARGQGCGAFDVPRAYLQGLQRPGQFNCAFHLTHFALPPGFNNNSSRQYVMSLWRMASCMLGPCHGVLRRAGCCSLHRRGCYIYSVRHESRTAAQQRAGFSSTDIANAQSAASISMEKEKLSVPIDAAMLPTGAWLHAWAPGYHALPEELPCSTNLDSAKQGELIRWDMDHIHVCSCAHAD